MKTILNIFILVSIIWAVQSPALYSPANNSTRISVECDLLWNKVDSAVDFQIQLDTSADFDSPGLLDTNSFAMNYGLGRRYVTVPTLSFGTSYYWRVKALGETVDSDWSSVRSFTTITAPSQYYPADNYSDNPVKFNLIWNLIDGTDKYVCQVDTSENFDSELLFESDSTVFYPSLGRQRIEVDSLHYGVKYFWRVKAVSTIDSSDWSAVRSFTTISAPKLYSPTSEKEVSADSVFLYWYKIEGSVSYMVDIDIDSSFSSIDQYSDTNTYYNNGMGRQAYTLKGLEDDTRYYWRVRAVNGVDTSDWSDYRTVKKGQPTAVALSNSIAKKSCLKIQNDFISMSNSVKPFSVEVYSVAGRKVFENREYSTNHKIFTSGIASGAYLVCQRFAGGGMNIFNLRLK